MTLREIFDKLFLQTETHIVSSFYKHICFIGWIFIGKSWFRKKCIYVDYYFTLYHFGSLTQLPARRNHWKTSKYKTQSQSCQFAYTWKFKHGFRGSFNAICCFGLDIATTCHYLIICHGFINKRLIILDTVSRINKDILTFSDTTVVKLPFYGDDSLNLATNTQSL